MFCVRSLAAAVNRRSGAVLLALSAVLAGCGGNSSRSEPYVPQKMVIFGDELSAVVTTDAPAANNGRKYSINTISTTTSQTDCNLSPVWPQVVAQYLNMVMAECNPSNVTPTVSMNAVPGATVAQVIAQMDAFRTNPANNASPSTLATVMAGQNDVIAAFLDYKNGANEADVRARMTTLGNQLGDAINALAAQGNGPRVLFALLPRISTSPFARNVAYTDADRQLLQELVDGNNKGYGGFNGALRLRVTNNGRWAAMIVTEVYFSPYITRDISLTGLANNSDPACTTPTLTTCTTDTLVTGAAGSATSYLWADDRHMSPIGHAAIGNEGVRQIRQGAF